MPIDYDKNPAQAMTMQTWREVERLTAHIGFNHEPLAQRPTIHANVAGVLTFAESHGHRPVELALVGALRILSDIPRYAGPDVARKRLREAASKGELLAYPRNSMTHVQPGDTIGEGTVHSIIDGRRFPDPRNGDPVPSVSRRALAIEGDRYVITFDSPKGGFARKGHMIPKDEGKLTFERKDLPRLRGIGRELKAEIRDEVARVRKGEGTPERLMNLGGIATSLRRMLDTLGKEPVSGRKAEVAFMRLRQRDLVTLDESLKRLEHDGSYPMGRQVDQAIAMVASERRDLATAIKSANKAIRAERPDPETAPTP